MSIKIPVGGNEFSVGINTLKNSGSPVFERVDSWTKFDRNSKHFATIITFMRDGGKPSLHMNRLDTFSDVELEEILAECQFYQFDAMSKFITDLVLARREAKLKHIEHRTIIYSDATFASVMREKREIEESGFVFVKSKVEGPLTILFYERKYRFGEPKPKESEQTTCQIQ